MSFKLTVAASIVGLFSGSNDVADVSAKLDKKKLVQFLEGAGAGMANLVFADTRTIAASGNDDLDLAGALESPVGAAAVFARVKAILVVAAAANTNDVVVGGAAATVFSGPFADATDKLKVPPGGMLLIANPSAAGWPVGAGVTDLLRIANGAAGTGVTYDVVIIGADA